MKPAAFYASLFLAGLLAGEVGSLLVTTVAGRVGLVGEILGTALGLAYVFVSGRPKKGSS